MDGTLEDRLAAVERALTDGDHDCSALAEGAANAQRVSDLETDVEELTDRVAELEAATQALRGYVGNIRSVNTDVEQRADLALSKAEAARRAVGRSGSGTKGEGREDATGSTPTNGDDPHEPGPEKERCERCDRPFEAGRAHSSPGFGSSQSESGGDASGLDALRDGSAGGTPDVEGQFAATTPPSTGTQTDGGVPDGADGETGSGALARIRDLL